MSNNSNEARDVKCSSSTLFKPKVISSRLSEQMQKSSNGAKFAPANGFGRKFSLTTGEQMARHMATLAIDPNLRNVVGQSSSSGNLHGKRSLVTDSTAEKTDRAAMDHNEWFKLNERNANLESVLFPENKVSSGSNFSEYKKAKVDIHIPKSLRLSLSERSRNDLVLDKHEQDNIMTDADGSFTGYKNVSDIFLENLKLMGITSPTPIQKYAYLYLSERINLLASAETGSGKTVAFLLPLLNLIYNDGPTMSLSMFRGGSVNNVFSPSCLIIGPTRELVHQIYEACSALCYRTQMRPFVCYGGIDIFSQFKKLNRQCKLLIGTPGRINDFISRGMVDLSNCKYVVFDEADRMLDMGFRPQIDEIFRNGKIPPPGKVTTCMFSATFDNAVKSIVNEYMGEYVTATMGRANASSKNVRQEVLMVPDRGQKDSKLLSLVNKEQKFLVFVSRKMDVDGVEMLLYNAGFKVVATHGDRTQHERNMAMKLFKENKANIMVATDVASRGLDIPNVDVVLNYDMPTHIDDYVHRVGRTGRMGNKGLSISFFSMQDTPIAGGLLNLLKLNEQVIPDFLSNFSTAFGRQPSRFPNSRYDSYSRGPTSFNSRSKYSNNRDESSMATGDMFGRMGDRAGGDRRYGRNSATMMKTSDGKRYGRRELDDDDDDDMGGGQMSERFFGSGARNGGRSNGGRSFSSNRGFKSRHFDSVGFDDD